MALTPKEIVHNIVTSGKIDDGVRMIEEAVNERLQYVLDNAHGGGNWRRIVSSAMYD